LKFSCEAMTQHELSNEGVKENIIASLWILPLAAVVDAVIGTDAHDSHHRFNPAAESMTGLAVERGARQIDDAGYSSSSSGKRPVIDRPARWW